MSVCCVDVVGQVGRCVSANCQLARHAIPRTRSLFVICWNRLRSDGSSLDHSCRTGTGTGPPKWHSHLTPLIDWLTHVFKLGDGVAISEKFWDNLFTFSDLLRHVASCVQSGILNYRSIEIETIYACFFNSIIGGWHCQMHSILAWFVNMLRHVKSCVKNQERNYLTIDMEKPD